MVRPPGHTRPVSWHVVCRYLMPRYMLATVAGGKGEERIHTHVNRRELVIDVYGTRTMQGSEDLCTRKIIRHHVSDDI